MCSFDEDEIKDKYIIRKIWLPVRGAPSDINVIYPIPRYTTSPEINELVQEISDRIKNDPDNLLKVHWQKLVRELKIKNLD